jgi:hypothetical protein
LSNDGCAVGIALLLAVFGRAVSEEVSKCALVAFLICSIIVVGINLIKRGKVKMKYAALSKSIGTLVCHNCEVLVVSDANDVRQVLKINGVQGHWEVTASLRDYGDEQELEAITLTRSPHGQVRGADELLCDGLFESGFLFFGNGGLLDQSLWPMLRREIGQKSCYVGDGIIGFAMPHGAGNAKIYVGRSEEGEIRLVLIRVINE